MRDTPRHSHRKTTVDRAAGHAPFLRGAIGALPLIVSEFVVHGARAAIALALESGAGEVGALLRQRRRALALAVALGDLAGELPLESVTAALSGFADQAIDMAVVQAIAERVPDAPPRGFAVLALGKLGSRELNYSSDVDLILLFDPATLPRRPREDCADAAVRIGRRVIDLLQTRTADGYVARVDLRLRPSPEVTPVVLPIDAAIAHYESSALPWERAAFIRARACAADRALGERFLQEIRPFVWRRSLDFGAIDEIRQISLRIRDHYAQVQAFAPGFDLKRGQGGIREAEFFTQVQQLVHGGREPALQAPATLDALAVLSHAGKLEPDAATVLADAYRALRTAEHRVQMVDDQQTHRLPADSAALDNVAQLSGLPDGAALLAGLAPHVAAVSHQFSGLISEAGERLSNDPDLLGAELGRMGFEDVATVARRIADWRSGRVRALRSPAALAAFHAMLPSLLRAIAGAADPAHALNRLSDVVDRVSSGVNFFRLLEARPALAELLAQILSHAPVLADQLARRPALLDGLLDESVFALPQDAEAIAVQLGKAITGEPFARALEMARRFVNERRFGLGVQLIAAHRDPLAVTAGYSDVAEGAIVALAGATEAEFARTHGRIAGAELLILGLGRLGGRALTHASDLDLVYLFDAPAGALSDGPKPLGATDYFNRLASRVSAALSVPTAAGPLYDVDTRLRPQGAQGMLAVSLAAFETYQRGEAWTWEHMALCRARPLSGSPAGRERLQQLVCGILRQPRDPAKVRADAAAMRLDMARHKPPAGPLDMKLGGGGLVDLEFGVHTLQLTHRVGLDPHLENAIAELAAAGLMDGVLDADLRLLTRMLVTLRLVAPSGEPAPANRALIAEACGHRSWEALLDAHGAARQRIAAFWNEVKR